MKFSKHKEEVALLKKRGHLYTSIPLKRKKVPIYIKGLLGFFIIVFITGLIALVYPIWPRIEFALKRTDPNKIAYDIALPTSFPKNDIGITSSENAKPIPKENRLVIPKIAVDSEIIDGNSLDVLNVYEGVWRESQNVTPKTQGNMVIAGHRFQYTPPNTNTFYNLEELVNGDKVIVFWESKMYIYEIYTTFDVIPEEVGIRDSSLNIPNEITLYTCTPLYTSQNRFVVKARLIT